MTEKALPLYPITIVATRYQGTYEGGAFAAFHAEPWRLPDAAFADDITCATWWEANGEAVGVGETPDEAYVKLMAIQEPLRFQWNWAKRRHETKRRHEASREASKPIELRQGDRVRVTYYAKHLRVTKNHAARVVRKSNRPSTAWQPTKCHVCEKTVPPSTLYLRGENQQILHLTCPEKIERT